MTLMTPSNIVAGRIVATGLASAHWYDTVSEEEGDTVSDSIDTLQWLATIGIIWTPGLDMAVLGWTARSLLNPVSVALIVPVVTGGVISYYIDGKDGVDNYVDFITSPDVIVARTFGNVPGLIEVDDPVAEQGGSLAVLEEQAVANFETLAPHYISFGKNVIQKKTSAIDGFLQSIAWMFDVEGSIN
jgi:hypothetical protein